MSNRGRTSCNTNPHNNYRCWNVTDRREQPIYADPIWNELHHWRWYGWILRVRRWRVDARWNNWCWAMHDSGNKGRTRPHWRDLRNYRRRRRLRNHIRRDNLVNLPVFSESIHCTSRLHCWPCRRRDEIGVSWRRRMSQRFEMPGPKTDFECPFGIPWGQPRNPSHGRTSGPGDIVHIVLHRLGFRGGKCDCARMRRIMNQWGWTQCTTIRLPQIVAWFSQKLLLSPDIATAEPETVASVVLEAISHMRPKY